VRRKLSGRLLIAGEHHLRRVLAEYLRHDNTSRPRRALGRVPPAHPHARHRRPASLSTGSAASRLTGGRTYDYQLAA
jgi:hypothetical protein